MKKKIIITSLIALGLTGVWSSHDAARAQTRKSITPLLRLSAQYDDNFYKTATNEISAWTYTVQPGLEAEVETARSYFALYYTLDAFFYSGLDQDLDYTGHTFKLDTGTRTMSDKLRLNIKDTFRRTRDAAELDYLGNDVGTEEFSINRFDPEALYELGRTNFKLAYSNVWVEYKESSGGTDSKENRGLAEVTYQINREAALGGNYQLWNKDYEGSGNDYDSQQIKMIFSYQGSRILLEGGLGWHDRKFDSASMSDVDLFVWDGILQWSNPRTDVIFRLDHNLNDQSTDGQYYKTTKLSLVLNYELSRKFNTRFAAIYQNSDYVYISREDDTWSTEGALDYDLFRWLILSGALGYQNRTSGVAAAEYDNFYGYAMLTFAYPFGTGTPVISPYK